MSSADLALQKALVMGLRADPELAELSGIFDVPPPAQPFPYLCFGAGWTADWGHKSGEGRDHRVLLCLWDEGSDTVRLRRLMAAVEGAALSVAPDLDGHRLVVIRPVRSLLVRDPMGPDQGIVELRAKTLAV